MSKTVVTWILIALAFLIGSLLAWDFTRARSLTPHVIVPYVRVTLGQATVERSGDTPQMIRLSAGTDQSEADVSAGDTIRTRVSSEATIFWPDGSLTRLGEKTSLKIHETEVSGDLTSVRIDFSLESGKTWSNVVTYIGEDSYFAQRFNGDNVVATVRGTVFEVNLDKEYVYTESHAVALVDQKNDASVLVGQGRAVSTKSLTEISLEILDSIWRTSNQLADTQYVAERLADVNQFITDSLSSGSALDRMGRAVDKSLWRYDPLLALQRAVQGGGIDEQTRQNASPEELMWLYQNVSSVSGDQNGFVEEKSELRETMVAQSTWAQRQRLTNDFARLTLLSLMNSSGEDASRLSASLDTFVQAGADVTILQDLTRAVSDDARKALQSASSILKNGSSPLYDALFAPSVNAIKNFDMENVRQINEAADRVKEWFADYLKSTLN